jgi:dihydropteroate synthase
MMFASRADNELPKGYTDGLLALHAKRPFPLSREEIEEAAREVSDKNFRIEIAEDGIHIFNRDGHHVAQDVFELFARLGVEEDGAHAFYLGAELAKAEIAWRLSKRYAQDEPLDWGVAADAPVDDRTRLKEAGHTLLAKKKRKA